MPTDRVRTVLVILFLLALFLGSLAGCGIGAP
jgi:predicted small lipoprotein YifL